MRFEQVIKHTLITVDPNEKVTGKIIGIDAKINIANILSAKSKK